MDGRLFLNSFFKTLVFLIVNFLEFQINATDSHHVALTEDCCYLAFGTLVSPSVHDDLVAKYNLPVRGRHLGWTVAKHPHCELPLE